MTGIPSSTPQSPTNSSVGQRQNYFERTTLGPWNFLELEDFPKRTFLVDDQGT